MDRRETAPEESGFAKDLKTETADYDDQVVYNGKTYRVPYKTVRELIITDVSKEEMKDIEHAARLQYRLLLLDSVLKAKVEFVKGRIIVTYNPKGALNRKEKTSREDLMQFLAAEGVNAESSKAIERDVDYFQEIYKYQFEPETIREHPPYGYTLEEWKKLKPQWEKMQKEGKAKKYENFQKFQEEYLASHPDISEENHNTAVKTSIIEKVSRFFRGGSL